MCRKDRTGAGLLHSLFEGDPMFSLKFKHYKWRENETKYFFLMVCLGLIATLKIVSIPLIIGVYILFSIFDNQIDKQKNSN